MLKVNNLLGAVTTLAYFSAMIVIFLLRLAGKVDVGTRLGLAQTLLALPLAAYLLFTARQFERTNLYSIQLGLFLAFLLLELWLDFILKLDFRQTRWMVIAYVTFFFAATGGLLGVASYAGRGWMIAAIILFFVMAILAFVQRAVTGM